MFGRKEPGKPIDEMSLTEVVELIRANRGEMLAPALISLAQRVTDIALFEHGMSDQERAIALELLPALDADIESVLQHEHGAWEAYRAAAVHHRDEARYYGVGSLQWLMDERGTEAAEVIPFIARKEHAELLPAYLEMMEPDVIYSIRNLLIGELAKARAREGELPVDVLNRLATGDDGALTLLFDGRQLGAISRAHIDRATAEAVLAELGVQS
jgi:hypothetical protein